MTESSFVRANSGNLPRLDISDIILYCQKNQNHNVAEIRGAKELSSSRESYVESAVGYVEVQRNSVICTVKAKVVPEHNTNSKYYIVSASLREDNQDIIESSCNSCAASLGGCKHSLLLLYWLQKRSLEPSPTSVQCYWRKPRLSNIGSETLSSSSIYTTTERRLDQKDPNIVKLFLTECEKHVCDHALICNMVNYRPDQLKNYSLFHMMLEFHKTTTSHSFTEFKMFGEAILNDSIKSNIAEGTLLQAQSNLWHSMRQCRITGSKLHEIAHCSTTDGSLIEAMLGGYKVPETKAILRGKKLESIVLKKAESILNCKIYQSGFLLLNSITGASPDGITENFIVEIKCPISNKTKLNYISTDAVIKNKCRAQLQLEMLCAKKNKAVLVIADPQFETNGNIELKWDKLDMAYLDNLLVKAEEFWKKIIFPKILYSTE